MGTSKAKSSLSSVGGGGAAGGGAAGLVRGLVASDAGVAPVPERLFLAAITPNDAPNTDIPFEKGPRVLCNCSAKSGIRPSPFSTTAGDVRFTMALEARFWRYDSRVLMPDWHEDAVAAPHKDTKRRVTPPSGFQSDYSRASQEVGVPGEVSTGAKPRRRMVTTQNFSAQISQPRRTELRPTVGGFDATLTRGASFEEERTTTFQRFHVLAPERAKRGPAPPEKGDDERAVGGYPARVNPVRPDAAVYSTSRAFFIKNATDRDFLDNTRDTTSLGSGIGGRCGARGPLVRNAGEAGCRNAPSVWADDYAHGV